MITADVRNCAGAAEKRGSRHKTRPQMNLHVSSQHLFYLIVKQRRRFCKKENFFAAGNRNWGFFGFRVQYGLFHNG